MKYEVVRVKHVFRAPDWSDSDLVEAEGPSQAAAEWAQDRHLSLGHLDEDGTVWVRDYEGHEELCFTYTFHMVPVVNVKWERDA